MGGRCAPHRPISFTCMAPTTKSAPIFMKFTQNVWMDEKISWTKNFWNRMGGRDASHRPIFLTFMAPTTKSAPIFRKFTQDVGWMRKCPGKTIFQLEWEGGVPLIDLYYSFVWHLPLKVHRSSWNSHRMCGWMKKYPGQKIFEIGLEGGIPLIDLYF